MSFREGITLWVVSSRAVTVAAVWEGLTVSMDMSRRGMRAAVAVLAAVAMMFGIGVGVSVAAGNKPRVQRTYHPCDLNQNTKSERGTGSTEDLCLRVWKHDAYTLSNKDGSYQETPAGPAVVVDLVEQARDEGRVYLRGALKNEIAMYAKRDR